MEQALGRPDLKDDDRFHLEFALGKALHDLGRGEEAFAHYAAGNALRREYHPFNGRPSTRLVDRSIELFTPRRPEAPGGMRRAGPDLHRRHAARRIDAWSSRSCRRTARSKGTSELPDMPAIARGRAANIRRPPSDLSADERRAAGRGISRRSRVQRRTDRPFFIDKLPNNWMFVPFIHLVLPNAKIIDARRHPLGCCMSNFRQHFARGQDFTYDLADLGRYYSDYVRLMAHVDAVLPGRVHRVIYERMVEDTEAEVRALLDYCGLEFEPACLEFYKTERAVRTPSSEQVRRPIYRDATEEWQAYEAHLDPLKDALGPVLDAYPDAPRTF